MPFDPRVDAYIAARAAFARPILEHLRKRLHAVCPEIEETIKWGMPFFVYNGRLLANAAAFKAHASFGFWDRVALPGAKEGEAMGQFGRLESLADLPGDAVIDAKIAEAIALIDAGDRPKRAARPPKPEAELPAALAAALSADPVAKKVFDAFPQSSRRDYCEWIADAKRDATRDKRVAEAIEWIRAGKRRHWKYETC